MPALKAALKQLKNMMVMSPYFSRYLPTFFNFLTAETLPTKYIIPAKHIYPNKTKYMMLKLFTNNDCTSMFYTISGSYVLYYWRGIL